jgi:undecaprenyl diphosphate synthase
LLSKKYAELLVIGNSSSPLFPRELRPYTKRTNFGNGVMNVSLLVNYGWLWDLSRAMNGSEGNGFTSVGAQG